MTTQQQLQQQKYLDQQNEFAKKFPIGTKMKVFQKTASYANGWLLPWSEVINIGDEGEIVDFDRFGVRMIILNELFAGITVYVPFFCLESIPTPPERILFKHDSEETTKTTKTTNTTNKPEKEIPVIVGGQYTAPGKPIYTIIYNYTGNDSKNLDYFLLVTDNFFYPDTPLTKTEMKKYMEDYNLEYIIPDTIKY